MPGRYLRTDKVDTEGKCERCGKNICKIEEIVKQVMPSVGIVISWNIINSYADKCK